MLPQKKSGQHNNHCSLSKKNILMFSYAVKYPRGVIICLSLTNVCELPTIMVVTISMFSKESIASNVVIFTFCPALSQLRTIPTGVLGDLQRINICQALCKGLARFLPLGLYSAITKSAFAAASTQ